MQVPLQVSFHHMNHSNAIEGIIREKAAKLEEYSDRIIKCRVVVEPVATSPQGNNLYGVHIDLTVPGEEIVVNKEPNQKIESKDLHAVLRDAFQCAKRQLEDYSRRHRGAVKSKPYLEERDGFVEAFDGVEEA